MRIVFELNSDRTILSLTGLINLVFLPNGALPRSLYASYLNTEFHSRVRPLFQNALKYGSSVI